MKPMIAFQKQLIHHSLKRCIRLSPCVRILLLLLFFVSVIIFFFCFIYIDLDVEKNRVLDEVNNLSEKLRQKTLTPVAHKKNKRLYTALKNMHAKKSSDIFKLTDEVAKKSSVSVISLRPEKYGPQLGSNISYYHLNISGEYPGIINFLKTFVAMTDLVSFSNIRLTAENSAGELHGALLLILDMHVYGKRE